MSLKTLRKSHLNVLILFFRPNTITLVGFAFNMSTVISLFVVYGIEMQGEVSRWWYLYGAFSYFMYRIMDELDGKQARNTGNSSVLGMLMDHGCDCISSVWLGIAGIKAFQMGASDFAFVLQTVVFGAFFFIVLEEYYKGYFYLGKLNAVSDGSLLIYFIFILTAIQGSAFWLNELTIFEVEMTYIQFFMGI